MQHDDEEEIDEGNSYAETIAKLQEDTKMNMDIFTSEFEILKGFVLSHMKEGTDKTIFYKAPYVQRLYTYLLESTKNDPKMRSYLDKKVMEWYQSDPDVSYMLLARSLNEVLKLYDVPVSSKIEERKRFIKSLQI